MTDFASWLKLREVATRCGAVIAAQASIIADRAKSLKLLLETEKSIKLNYNIQPGTLLGYIFNMAKLYHLESLQCPSK